MKNDKSTKHTTKVITLADSFGQRNDYYVFAVRSDSELLHFTAQLATSLNTDFATLGDIETPLPFKAKFCSFYAYVAEEKINLFILENRTSRCVEERVSDAEKNLPFHTLSLFATEAFLCNHIGHSEFVWNYENADYLFLIYVDKGHDIAPFRKLLDKCEFMRYEDKTEDVFRQSENISKKNKGKDILIFFRSLFNELDNKAIILEEKGKNILFRHLSEEQKKIFSFGGCAEFFNYPTLSPAMVRFLLTDTTYTPHNEK